MKKKKSMRVGGVNSQEFFKLRSLIRSASVSLCIGWGGGLLPPVDAKARPSPPLPGDSETFAFGDSSAYPVAPGISAPSGRPADWHHRELTTKFNTATETLTAGFCEIDFCISYR